MVSASASRPGAATEDRCLTVRTVTVLGASGQTGRALIEQLLARGVQVRAVTRPRSKASFPPAVDVVHGDLADPDTLVEALRKVDAVYHIPPAFSPHEVAFGRNVITAAATAGVRRVVYHSVMRSMTPSMPHHWRKWMVEESLRSSQLDWTILRPAMYMQTPVAFLDASRTTMVLGLSPQRLFTPVDVEDVAQAAAEVLLTPGHTGQAYELAGSEVWSMGHMAEHMARAWGHPVVIRRLPSGLVALVASRRYGRGSYRPIKAMFDHYDTDGFVGSPDDLRALLDRTPTSFDMAMRRLAPT